MLVGFNTLVQSVNKNNKASQITQKILQFLNECEKTNKYGLP